jgi:hypothetical protein
MPTSARLGYDNDTVTISSTVINANIPGSELSTSLVAATSFPAYAGNRVRVIKKSAIYTVKAPLAIASQFDGGGFAARSGGDYYDLYTTAAGPLGTPVDSGIAAGVPPMPYTVVFNNTPCVPGVATLFSNTACEAIIYEPQRLRGRAMATFSNLALPAGVGSSQNYLVGTRYIGDFNPAQPDNGLFFQGVRLINGTAPATTFGAIPFYPVLQTANVVPGGEQNGNGTPTGIGVDTFQSPAIVPQQTFRGGGPAPLLFVGDTRPHKVIFREGHIYDARVMGANTPAQGLFSPSALATTVDYDIVQKLLAAQTPRLILTAKPTNFEAHAPMFDVPADVKTYGLLFGANQTAALDRTTDFFATTFPPLAGLPDAGPWLGDASPGAGDPRSRATFGSSGVGSVQLSADPGGSIANCFNYQLSPGVTPTGGVGNEPRAWASLLDVRCGQDATDSSVQVRDPHSGLFAGKVAYTVRGDAGIDPNDGSIWVYGAYAQKRNVTTGSTAHWGTFGANYKMYMPLTDELGNSVNLYNDVVGLPEAPFIQIAANVGLAPNTASSVPNITPLPFSANLVYGPAGVPVPAGFTVPGAAPAAGSFGPNDAITRREMAAWIVKSQMDEAAITAYLNATGGTSVVTFADVPPDASTATMPGNGWRYIEVMARRGYTSGCAAGTARRFCPDWISTRKDLAVFMIRAKMSNVFPSTLSGCAFTFVTGATPASSTLFPPNLTTNCTGGDNFGLFVTGLPYFTDNPAPIQVGNDEYPFIQKMRELGVTVGTSLGPNLDGRGGTYSRGVVGGPPPLGDPGNLLRKQVAVFMIRGFFF